MADFFQYLVMLVVLMVSYQLYTYAVHLTGEPKQKTCRKLGVFFATLAITGFAMRSHPPVVIGGLVLFMLGLRLMAHGLDRLNKKVFIDRFEEDQ